MNKPQTGFKAMTESTKEEWQEIATHMLPFIGSVAGRIVDHLKILDGDYGGFPIDRLQHCLQTATRAHRDNRDEEYVVCALLHDIGDTLGPSNHPDVAAAILQPYVSEENHWIVKHHGVLQGYYFFHYIGLDRNARDEFKDHKHYDACFEFCEKYDQNSFDGDYDTETLEFFIPMLERVFAMPKNSRYQAALDAAG